MPMMATSSQTSRMTVEMIASLRMPDAIRSVRRATAEEISSLATELGFARNEFVVWPKSLSSPARDATAPRLNVSAASSGKEIFAFSWTHVRPFWMPSILRRMRQLRTSVMGS